jgi:hypothetical protein
VTLYRSCVNRRFEGTHCLHLHERKPLQRGTSVSRWVQTEPPVRVRVTLRLTVSQSVCLGVEPHLGLMTRYLIIYLICWKLQSCLWGRPVWREVGSVACQSVICVMSLSVCTYNVFTKHITYKMKCLIYNMYKASVSPGSVQVSQQSKTSSYIRTGRKGEWATCSR